MKVKFYNFNFKGDTEFWILIHYFVLRDRKNGNEENEMRNIEIVKRIW